MNKTEFINALKSEINYSESNCLLINDILEKHFFIRSKNKDKIIEELINTFNIQENEALIIYVIARDILNREIKNKLKHPFKSKD